MLFVLPNAQLTRNLGAVRIVVKLSDSETTMRTARKLSSAAACYTHSLHMKQPVEVHDYYIHPAVHFLLLVRLPYAINVEDMTAMLKQKTDSVWSGILK